MKQFQKLALPAMIAMLVGCGSDSDSLPTPPVETPDPIPPVERPVNDYDNINVKLAPNQVLDGTINVKIGKWVPCLGNADTSAVHDERYKGFCELDMKGDPVINPHSGKYQNRQTEFDYQRFDVDAGDLQRVLGQSIRPEVMAEGQFSLLDMALYLGKTRSDLEVEITEFDKSLDTHKFIVSYDWNRDGEFTLEGDGAEYYKNPNWWPASHYSNGEFLRDVNDAPMEAYYNRADTVPLQAGQSFRLRPYSEHMTQRREEMQRREVQRLADNSDGKTVIPVIEADFGDGRGYVEIARDIKVRGFNLRPDIYQPGVLTIADVIMSMYHDYEMDIGLTYWPVTTNDAPIQSYALSRIFENEANGYWGWLMIAGEPTGPAGMPAASDFNSGMNSISVAELVGTTGNCGWLGELTADSTDADGNFVMGTARACKEDFAQSFGGDFVHIMPDNWVINNPPAKIRFLWNYQNMLWETPEFLWNDGQFQWHDISKADEVMDDSHFGWGQADCAQCHDADKVHIGTKSTATSGLTEPYQCASCHGSNGAPQGHGEDSRCHWCHTKEYAPAHHGSASIRVPGDQITCWPDSNSDRVHAPCAAGSKLRQRPTDRADNETTYDEQRLFPVNSDWSQSQDFPDPYSCLTCHPNEVMEAPTPPMEGGFPPGAPGS